MTQSGLIERFHARYPHLRVEFVTSDRYLDLSKGEAESPSAPAIPTMN